MNKLLLVLIFALACSHSWGQADLFGRLKEKFPDEPAVFVDRSEVVYLVPEGDSLRAYSDVFEDVLHLKEPSDGFMSKRVYGSHFNQVSNLKAKTLLWDKNRYKEMQVSGFRKNSDRDDAIFYDDSYYYSFNFPSLAMRNRSQVEYRENLKDPRFLTGFTFTSYLPQAKVSYVIKTTPGVELFHEVYNDPTSMIRFTKTVKGNTVTYEWTAEDVPIIRSEDNSPDRRYVVPHVVCYVKSYKNSKGSSVRVLSDLNDLYRWYYTMISHLNRENSEELISIAKELKAKSETELDFVKNVFYWVQSNIKYIAFEQGMRGLIPHHGSYVCEKRYGDCKDMANIIVNLLSVGGVKSYHTWIGTRDIPYQYTRVSSPLVDNHMIATYVASDGKYYFLDATSNYTPFGYPSSMIQGKEALIAFDEQKFEVREVPVIQRDANVMTDDMIVTVDNNFVITGKGKATLSGFAKVFGAYELDRAEKEDVKKYVTKLMGKGNNKFFLEGYDVKDLYDRDRPTSIDYGFRISDYARQAGSELYLNMNFNKDYYNSFINIDKRKMPFENSYLYTKYENIELKIPEGYEVEHTPPDFSTDDGFVGCTIRYERKGQSIFVRKVFFLNYLLLNPSEFSRWNKAIASISEAYRESIILIKK